MKNCDAELKSGEGAFEDARYDSGKKKHSGDFEIQKWHRIVKQAENQSLENQSWKFHQSKGFLCLDELFLRDLTNLLPPN